MSNKPEVAAAKPGAKLRVTLIKSPTKYSERHKRTVRALGLHRMHQTVEHVDGPVARGMIAKVAFLVAVEEVK